MAKRGVAVFFGTMERANEKLVDVSLQDPAVAPHVKGVGFQWAGKGAIAGIHRRYPELPLYQTEQECGDGRNDWRYCRYAWTLMKHYLRNGASAYLYWNISLTKGGVSRWGWAQNSLVTVDADARTYAYTHEYYLMKHLSAFVRPGARRVETVSWTRLREPARVRQPRREHRRRDPERHARAAAGAHPWSAGRSSRRPCRPTRSARSSSGASGPSLSRPDTRARVAANLRFERPRAPSPPRRLRACARPRRGAGRPGRRRRRSRCAGDGAGIASSGPVAQTASAPPSFRATWHATMPAASYRPAFASWMSAAGPLSTSSRIRS